MGVSRKTPMGPPDSEPKPRRESGVRPSAPGRPHRERRHNRFPVELGVRFAAKGEPPVSARCANLSLGGMFIVTDAPGDADTELRLWLTLPDATELFLTGSIRWRSAGGMGVQHTLLGARDTFVLTEFLAGLPPA